LAVSTVGVAVALVAVLWPALGQSPTLFFLLAVTLSAWYGGLGPGLVSTGLSLVVLTPSLLRLGPAGLVRLAMFTAIALLVSALTATRARSRAALQRAHDELEQRSAAVERQRERLAALVDVTQRLTRGLELPVVLNTIAEAAATVLGGEAAFRLVEGEYLVRMGATPGAKAAMPRDRLRIGESLSGRAAATGEAIVTDDIAADERVIAEHRAPRDPRVGALLCVPIRVGASILGTLNVYRERGHRFDAAAITLARSFADQAGIAIENARLYADAERRRREAEAIADLTRTISSTLDLDTVLARVAGRARELCASDVALIAVGGARSPAMMFRHWPGARFQGYDRVAIQPGKGVGGRVLETGQPFRTDNYAEDPRISKEYLDAVQAEGVVAEIVVPIRSEERIEGLLYVLNRSRRAFSDRDEAILLRLADHAAIAIRNARLFAREQTARADAEATAEALRASEEQYRALVEGSIQGVYIHVDRIVQFANAAAARIFGCASPAELVGLDYLTLLAPHERARLESYRTRRLRGEPVPPQYEWQGVRRDGAPISIESVVSVVSWKGEPAVLVTLLDVTERHRAAEALRQSEEHLRQAQKMEAVGRLAGGIAHDFNNLLTVIKGRTQLLQRRVAPEDPLRHQVKLVEDAADRATALIHQLLAFSRRQILQPRMLDLNAVVADMHAMLERLIGEHIALVTVSAATLGPVKADRGQLEQVIMNLAVNARDAMPGGGRLTLRTADATLDEAAVAAQPGLRPGPFVLLSVSDTGTGMDAETRARLFEPFFTTKGPGKGTGLGLSTVYGIVQQHSGCIVVTSELGQGSTFEIYLPRAEEAVEPEDDAAAVGASPTGAETVLLVEDETAVRDLARDILEMQGYTVLEARDGAEALRVGAERLDAIALILTDVVMPGMSGYELVQRLAPLRPGVKVLYMSGYTTDPIVHDGVLARGVAFLKKPFSADELARKVREVLDTA
jgi:PAS domain S-box-containing protein